MSRLRALLATLRIANAPSVVSNVTLGYMLGWILWSWGWDHDPRVGFSWPILFSLWSVGLLLYFGGNLANDWHDRLWDETRRPERALPSGIFRPGTFLVAALACIAAATAIAVLIHPASGFCAVVITALIALYTRYHKRAIWPVVPMGLCRAGLYVLGCFATLPPISYFEAAGIGSIATHPLRFAMLATLASGLMAYVIGLSLSARYESMDHPPPGPLVISKALLLLPFPAMSCWWMTDYPLLGILGMIPAAVWLVLSFTILRKPISRFVSALLAGIPLVDLIAFTPMAGAIESRVLQDTLTKPPFVMGLLAIPLAAFVLGRLLQKVAPAT